MISMSERSSISLAEVLGENYYIDKLTSSEYSPAVGDTVTITLSVKDVFGDPANGQTRTVTCTGGSFVSVNGSSITSSSSVEVTTGSGGTVTLGLSVSVADTIIVSDGRCDCVVCSLSNSITNSTQLYQTTRVMNVNMHFVNSTSYTLYRIGHIVIAHLWNSQCKPASTGWLPITSIPDGYKPVDNVYGTVTIPDSAYVTQVSTVDNNTIRANVKSTPSSNIYFGFLFVWVTTDDYPSQ